MAVVDRNTLKQWFVRGARPTAEQFASWIDSFFHRDDKVPATSVEGLQVAFDAKADRGALNTVSELVQELGQAIEAEATTRAEGDAGKMNKKSVAVSGNFVVFGADGDAEDSGKKFTTTLSENGTENEIPSARSVIDLMSWN